MLDDEENGNGDSAPKKGHALEQFLNIEPTEMEKVEYEKKPLAKIEEYDTKDAEIEDQIQEIFENAMSGYLSLEALLDGVEPKYRARLAEVALQYLNAGLNAANSKAKQKEHKDKLLSKEKSSTSGKGNTTNNIVFSGDRNEAIRMARDMLRKEDTIDAEVIQNDESDSK